MIDGMAYLKIFENQACTRELPKDENGNYILNISFLTANAQEPYQIILWVKNDGSHSAYDSSVTIESSTISNSQVDVQLPSVIYSQEIKKTLISFPTVQGLTGEHTITLRIYYDNI